MRYNLAALQNLVDQFERMQGIGHKTAQRMAFYVLGLSDEETRAFTDAITEAHTKIHQCKICCNLAEEAIQLTGELGLSVEGHQQPGPGQKRSLRGGGSAGCGRH